MACQLKGVLFDLDDTLIDWSGVELGWREIEAEHLSQVLAYLDFKPSESHVKLERLVDLYTQRTREAWARARADLIAPNMPGILSATLTEIGIAEADLYLKEILDTYDWNAVPGTVVFPDVLPLLKTLRLSGIKLGIVTNASQPMWMRDAELVWHGLIDFFPDCRLSAADSGYLKPHPRIFEAALERMGTTPAETVFVGDNPVADIAGAQSFGMRAVRRVIGRAVVNGNLTPPHPCLHSLEELPAILDQWYPDWQTSGA